MQVNQQKPKIAAELQQQKIEEKEIVQSIRH